MTRPVINAQDTNSRHRRTNRLLSANRSFPRSAMGRLEAAGPAGRISKHFFFSDRIPTPSHPAAGQGSCPRGFRLRMRDDCPPRSRRGAAPRDNANLTPKNESFGRHQNIPQAVPGRNSGQ